MGLSIYLFDEKSNEVAFLRKANQIRAWFVRRYDIVASENQLNFQIKKSDLADLLKDCQSVLRKHSKAAEILPTAEGFFFGDTDYCDDYYENLQIAVARCKTILQTFDWNKHELWYDECW